MERFQAESNIRKDTDSGTPRDPLPPIGVLLLATEAINPSTVTLLPTVEAAAESLLINDFKAPYDKLIIRCILASQSLPPDSLPHIQCKL